jgi:hypothetical protein
VVSLVGWIDAGGAAAAAAELLVSELDARPVVTFDRDTFIDYRARRPVLELRDGVSTQLVWPSIELRAGRAAGGKDVLVLTGYEPDMAWHRFTSAVSDVARELGVRRMVGFGAYPFATPHTRAARLSITCGTAELAATLPFLRNSVDVPAGASAAIEQQLTLDGVTAYTLWAQVPHYVAAYPYPAASLALLGGLHDVEGVEIPITALQHEAEEHRSRLDELVAGNAEHQALVRQLEGIYDAEVAQSQEGLPQPPAANLPSGDEIAAELERFLRDHGKG